MRLIVAIRQANQAVDRVCVRIDMPELSEKRQANTVLWIRV